MLAKPPEGARMITAQVDTNWSCLQFEDRCIIQLVFYLSHQTYPSAKNPPVSYSPDSPD